MGLANRYLPYSANINTAGGTTGWVNQIESSTTESGVSLFEETTGSETDRQFVAARSINPTIQLTSSDLTALTTVGIGGVPITPASGTPGVTIYGRQLPLESLPAAIGSSSHISCVVSDGLLIPKSVRASHNDVARLQLEVHAILGTTATYSNSTPLKFATAQTIPSGSAVTANIFTTGPVKFTSGSSTLCQGISQIGVDFGIQPLKESTDGEVYPSHVSLIARGPRMEFTTKDPTLIAAIGDGLSVTSFAVDSRAVQANGQRVARATTSHVSVTGTAGMLTPGSVNLTHKRGGEAAFTFTPVLNTNIITISASAAIPTS